MRSISWIWLAPLLCVLAIGCGTKAPDSPDAPTDPPKKVASDATADSRQPATTDLPVASSSNNTAAAPTNSSSALTLSQAATTFVSDDYFVAIALHPKKIGDRRLVQNLLSIDMVKERLADNPAEVPFDPMTIDWILAVVGHQMGDGDSPLAGAFQFDSVEAAEKMRAVGQKAEVAKVKGVSIYVASDPAYHMYWANETTVVFGSAERLTRFLNGSQKPAVELLDRLKQVGYDHDIAVVTHMAPVRDLVANSVAGQGKSVENMPDQVKAATLTFDLEGAKLLNVLIEGKDPAAGEAIGGLLNQGLEAISTPLGLFGMDYLAPRVGEEGAVTLLDAANSLLQNVEIQQNGPDVSLSIAAPEGLADLPTKLAPLLAKWQEQVAGPQERINNLKQVGLALLSYHDQNGRFPAAALYNEKGDAVLSWRVAILPFMEGTTLYDAFNMDEPWNSEHNLQTSQVMIPVYGPPKDSRKPGPLLPGNNTAPKLPQEAQPAVAVPPSDGPDPASVPLTRFQVFVGPSTFFATTRGTRMAEATDGTSNSILVVETGPDKAVPWSKPADLAVDDDPVAALGTLDPEGALVLFGDGSVRRMSPSELKAVLKDMISINGGEVISEN
ncbi:DUF1559 family PulG-like putative transporter [Lignipirellula cremea]|uniref:DUF1559 domain-containing protein n=1 Tax=Lignipirellula cremea TaxID=2528010 RepID=A0A518DVN2_9BACT|nr:DUF1559 domain-containing protein [Lignipirellula cremea]QDU95897.1 hypothetical protein Pla8534_37160 [Lignipirellula cremea]